MRVYAAMLGEANAVVGESDNKMVVYEGFLTSLITGKLNLSVPYYTSVMKALKRMGCVRQLRRGGGNSASQWELITEPTIEAFENQREIKPKQPTQLEVANEQILALSSRLSALEEWQEGVNEFLAQKFGLETPE